MTKKAWHIFKYTGYTDNEYLKEATWFSYERSGVMKLQLGPKSDEFEGKNCCEVYTHSMVYWYLK